MKSVLNCDPSPEYNGFAHLFLCRLKRLGHHVLVSPKSRNTTYCNTIIVFFEKFSLHRILLKIVISLATIFLRQAYIKTYNLNIYLVLTFSSLYLKMCEMILLIIAKKSNPRICIWLLWALVLRKKKKNLVNSDRYFRKTAPNDINWRGLVNNMMKNSSITR